MLVNHVTELASTPAAGLFLSPLGISFLGIFGLFGIFIPIILILAVANLAGGRSRSHGDPSGLGVVLGLGLFFALTVAIGYAAG
jgi:hypothetical protein